MASFLAARVLMDSRVSSGLSRSANGVNAPGWMDRIGSLGSAILLVLVVARRAQRSVSCWSQRRRQATELESDLEAGRTGAAYLSTKRMTSFLPFARSSSLSCARLALALASRTGSTSSNARS